MADEEVLERDKTGKSALKKTPTQLILSSQGQNMIKNSWVDDVLKFIEGSMRNLPFLRQCKKAKDSLRKHLKVTPFAQYTPKSKERIANYSGFQPFFICRPLNDFKWRRGTPWIS